MLSWAIIFFVATVIAYLFGFDGAVTAYSGIAQMLFFLFLVLCIVSFAVSIARAMKGDPGGPW